jgi:hypothetical protein
MLVSGAMLSARGQQGQPPTPVTSPGGPAGGTALQDPLSPAELKKYALDRYERIVKKSPFAFEIFAPEGPATDSAFTDWKLAGYTIDEGKGVVSATLLNEKSGEKAVVDNVQPHKTLEIQLVQLEVNDDWRQSKVRLRKGRDEEVIEFSKKALETRPTIVPMAAMAQQQGQQPQTGAFPPGVNVPGARGNNIRTQINQAVANQPGVNLPPQPNAAVATQQQPAVQGVGIQANQVGMRGRQGGPPGQGQNSPPRRRVILPPPTNR